MRARTLLPVLVAAASLALPAAAHAASTTLVINEVDYDQPSTDTAEFLELKNVSDAAHRPGPVLRRARQRQRRRRRDLPDGRAAGRRPRGGRPLRHLRERGEHAELRPGREPRTRTGPRTARPTAPACATGRRSWTRSATRATPARRTRRARGSGSRTRPRVGEGLSRCGADTDQNNADFLLRGITPGADNACPPPPIPFGACGDGGATPIHDLQGNGAASPIAGTQAVIEGVVVGDFAGAGGLGGFFVQEEDTERDDESADLGGRLRRLGASRSTPATSSACAARSPRASAARSSARVTRVEVCPGEGTATTTQVQLPVGEPGRLGAARGHGRHAPAGPDDLGVLRLRPLQRDRPLGRPPDDPDGRVRPGLARGGGARAGQPARPDHARRRPQHGELRSGAAPGRRRVRPGPPLPRRRHGRGRHRRARLRLRRLPRPADGGRRVHRGQRAAGRAGGRRRQRQGRLVQRPELLHDARRATRAARTRRRSSSASGPRSSPRSRRSTRTSSA